MSRTVSRLLLLVVGLSILLQITIAFLPDTMGDLISYRDWSRALVREGFVAAYLDSSALHQRGTEIIYPPLIPTLFWAIGQMLSLICPRLFFDNNYFLDVVLKLIFVLFNILILLILYLEYEENDDKKTIVAALCAYGFNPGVIFNTSYWGQTDSISTCLIVLALFLLSRSARPGLAAAVAAMAILAKPTVWPIALLIAVAILRRNNLRRVVSSALLAITVIVAFLTPFILSNRTLDALRAIMNQVDASPYVSANAHNLWWILQGGLPMIHADMPFVGALSYKICGILFSGLFIIITLWKFWNSESRRALYFAAASMAFGFYILSTHMHENHLFGFFAIFALIAFRDVRFRRLFYLLSGVFLANLLLHDPYINYVVGNHVSARRLNLPFSSLEDSPIAKTFQQEGKSYVLLERSGKISVIRFFLTFLNAQLAVIIFVYWLLAYYKKRTFDFQESHSKIRLIPRVGFVTASGMIVVTSLFQFMSKAFRSF